MPASNEFLDRDRVETPVIVNVRRLAGDFRRHTIEGRRRAGRTSTPVNWIEARTMRARA